MKRFLLLAALATPLVAADYLKPFRLAVPWVQGDRLFTAALIGQYAAQAGDDWTTRRALASGGQELNPILRPLYQHPPGGELFKASIAGGQVAFWKWSYKRCKFELGCRRFIRAVALASDVVFIGLAVRNERLRRRP